MNQFKTSILALPAFCFLFAAYQACPALAATPTNIFNVLMFGAVGDGKTMNNEAIQKTIDAASATGGGIVLIPAGKFLTGPFRLASRINLHLDRGAFILISDDVKHYPMRDGKYQDAITAADAQNIEISGQGTIDGQGQAWWTAFDRSLAPKKSEYVRASIRSNMPSRPCLIKLSNCTGVLVDGITLCNSPRFHLLLENCTGATIRGITIKSPSDSPNTDGIDPSGWNYLITDCTIDCGDDNIAVKPCQSRTPGNKNYTITNCTFLHGRGLSIGSGTRGGIENLLASHCTFDSTADGIHIKTVRGRGGLLQNLTFENLTMTGIKRPIDIIDWYPEQIAPTDPSTEKSEPITDKTPINKNITIRNVTATNCLTAGIIRGLPEAPITDVTLQNVTITAQTGMKIYHANGIRFAGSKINVENGKALITFNANITGLE